MNRHVIVKADDHHPEGIIRHIAKSSERTSEMEILQARGPVDPAASVMLAMDQEVRGTLSEARGPRTKGEAQTTTVRCSR